MAHYVILPDIRTGNLLKFSPSLTKQAFKALLEKIARFLVENTDGHVNCNISVRSSMKEKDYHVTDVEDIIIGHEDFNQEKLMPIFNKILKKNQIIE